MTSKPILRVGKVKASGRSTPQSVQAHLSRSRPTPNADPARTGRNVWLVDPKGDLSQAIDDVTRKAGIDPASRRSDAVVANDVLLTISPEWFRPDDPERSGTWRPERLKAFRAEAEAFLKETFGVRLVAAVLHLDEATPHVQAVVVPIMPGKSDRSQLRLSSKDMFNPKGLTALQQRWEDRMRPHGVGPRTKGSRARHTTLREYYGALEATRASDRRPTIKISEPPQKGLFQGSESHRREVEDWKRAEAKRLKDELRPLARDASRGRLYDAERRSGVELRAALADKAEKLGQAYEQMGLDDAEIRKLRNTPINDVAAALGHTGPIGPKENAIDLVKRVGELEYRPAVAWLAQRFGPEVAATAVREDALRAAERDVSAKAVLTKAERTKVRLVGQQLDALAAPAYRITVMTDRDGSQVGQNLGKSEDGERFFSRNEVINLIPDLTVANARGGNIFVTPIEDGTHHVLIDDLEASGIESLTGRGYTPATVVESSPGSFQAVLKVPAASTDKADVNSWFKDLNRDLGDPKITGLRHPFRLVGFENRKAKHEQDDGRFPFVRLVTAVNRICGRAVEVVQGYAQKRLDIERQPKPKGPRL